MLLSVLHRKVSQHAAIRMCLARYSDGGQAAYQTADQIPPKLAGLSDRHFKACTRARCVALL